MVILFRSPDCHEDIASHDGFETEIGKLQGLHPRFRRKDRKLDAIV